MSNLTSGAFGSGEGAAGSDQLGQPARAWRAGRAQRRIYLDDAGAAPVLPEVAAAVQNLPQANPSSLHREGREARAALDHARDVVAEELRADRTEITFTSSGTESVNLALFGVARRLSKSSRIVTWAAEHQSVLGAVRKLQADGYEVVIAPVDGAAIGDPDAVTPGTALVSIGLANNEVGTIQPVQAIVARAHQVGALVHVDACAGPRWIDIPDGPDLISFSGQKLGGGRGGALFVRDGVRIDPLFYGGPQEWGRRAGHEDVAAATSVAIALQTCGRTRRLRSSAAATQSLSLRELLSACGGQLTGGTDRLPNFATATFRGRRGEDMLLALDLEGLAASSGSACASGSLDPSHVLLAMGLDLPEALGSLRLTTGYATTDEDVARAGAIISTLLTAAAAHA